MASYPDKYFRKYLPRIAAIVFFCFTCTLKLNAQKTDSTPADRLLSKDLDTTIGAPPEPEVQLDTSIVVEEKPVADTAESKEEEAINYFDVIPAKFDRNHLPRHTIRHIAANRLAEFKSDPAFCYADARPPVQQKESVNTGSNDATKIFFWAAIIVAALLILFLFLKNSNLIFFSRTKKIDEELEEQTSTEDIFNINYEREIQRSISQKNYRFATRLMFLRLLRSLSVNNIIQYRHDGTNLDYLLQLRTSPLYQDFFRVTRAYEYCWYGQFDLSEERFNQLKNEFEQLHKNFR